VAGEAALTRTGRELFSKESEASSWGPGQVGEEEREDESPHGFRVEGLGRLGIPFPLLEAPCSEEVLWSLAAFSATSGFPLRMRRDLECGNFRFCRSRADGGCVLTPWWSEYSWSRARARDELLTEIATILEVELEARRNGWSKSGFAVHGRGKGTRGRRGPGWGGELGGRRAAGTR